MFKNNMEYVFQIFTLFDNLLKALSNWMNFSPLRHVSTEFIKIIIAQYGLVLLVIKKKMKKYLSRIHHNDNNSCFCQSIVAVYFSGTDE